ncbi:MAG: elongation factor G [Planctomycetes bacterium]|nr:elongation factor G [Planctomycetota bacterium]
MSSDLASLRNVALVGHSSAGKTSLLDAMAHALGAGERKGSVTDKTSIGDTEPEEQEKGHTFQLKLVYASKGGTRWNLLDTPGYPEFGADALAAMFACELVLGVANCASPVSYNLRNKLQQAKELGRARAIVVTHVDVENANFEQQVADLQKKIGEECVPYFVPDKSGKGFARVMRATAGEWKKPLFDRVMDACEDEAMLLQYLESEELSDEALKQHMPRAIAKGTLVPILIVNPLTGAGLEEMLAFLRDFGPSPEGSHNKVGGAELAPSANGAFLGVVFNVKSDPHVGKICLARVLRGTLKASDLVGPGRGEKIGGLFHPVGSKGKVNADAVSAGELIAISKVEHLVWGHSFALTGVEPTPVEVPQNPPPQVALALHLKSRNDEQKIGPALAKLASEDPTFHVTHDATTHELVIHGMSDLHLQVMEHRLKRRFGIEITTSLPRIAYKETITKPTDAHHRHKKQSGGRGQFGECFLRLKPAPKDAGIVFVDAVVGGAIPRNLIPAIEKGVRESAALGILTHSQVVDVEVAVYDGKYHDVDSDEASFKRAGQMAFREGFMKAGPVLMEPVMSVEIRVPTEHAGHIFSDLTSHRRGTVHNQESEHDGHVTVIQAHAPLAAMLTYHRDLKSQTAGEGTYTMKPDHYARVPAVEQERIITQVARKHVDED